MKKAVLFQLNNPLIHPKMLLKKLTMPDVTPMPVVSEKFLGARSTWLES